MHATLGVFDIALVTRDDMNVQVMDGLARPLTDIDAGVVAVRVFFYPLSFCLP